jgi:hypothetical protein
MGDHGWLSTIDGSNGTPPGPGAPGVSIGTAAAATTGTVVGAAAASEEEVGSGEPVTVTSGSVMVPSPGPSGGEGDPVIVTSGMVTTPLEFASPGAAE